MKKKIIFIILGIILVLGVIVVGVVGLFTTLTKEKNSMTSAEFKTVMESRDFVVFDATSQFSEYSYIKQVYVATPNDYSYKIEFYELSDEVNATAFYNNNKSIFESKKGSTSGETSVNMSNYSKYSLSTNGKFQGVYRINNTVIYLDVDSNYTDTVKELLNDLGY